MIKWYKNKIDVEYESIGSLFPQDLRKYSSSIFIGYFIHFYPPFQFSSLLSQSYLTKSSLTFYSSSLIVKRYSNLRLVWFDLINDIKVRKLKKKLILLSSSFLLLLFKKK